MNTQNVSLTTPTDYSSEAIAIERKRKLAEALQAQGMQQQPTEMVGGWAIPQGQGAVFSKLAQSLAGAYGQGQANKQEKDLASKYQSDLINTVLASEKARLGSPGNPSPPDELGGGPAQPATPANTQLANALLMGHPATQGLGLQGMQRDMQIQQFMNMGGQQSQPNSVVPGPGTSPPAGAPGATPPAPAQVPGFGGPAGGVPMGVWLQADPTGSKYIEQLAKDQAPVNVRPGGTVYLPGRGPQFTAPQNGVQTQWGAQGPTAGAVPGAQEAIARGAGLTTGAQTAAKAPYETVPVTQASGAVVPTPLLQIPGIGQGAPQGGAPQSTPTATPAAPKTALSGPWATMPKLATPTGMGQSTYQHTVQTQQGETANKLSEKYGAIADSANQRLALNQQAQGLVDKADTGPMAAQIGDVKNWLVSRVGIPESSFANTPSATIALQKDLLNAATQKAKAQFGSRMTQSEVMLMLARGSPNVDMTKASIKYLLQSDSAAATYQVQQANDLGKYLSSGGDPMRFEGWYSKSFPLSQSLGDVHFSAAGKSSPSGTISWDSLKQK